MLCTLTELMGYRVDAIKTNASWNPEVPITRAYEREPPIKPHGHG